MMLYEAVTVKVTGLWPVFASRPLTATPVQTGRRTLARAVGLCVGSPAGGGLRRDGRMAGSRTRGFAGAVHQLSEHDCAGRRQLRRLRAERSVTPRPDRHTGPAAGGPARAPLPARRRPGAPPPAPVPAPRPPGAPPAAPAAPAAPRTPAPVGSTTSVAAGPGPAVMGAS